MYRLLVSVFDGVDRLLSAIGDGIRGFFRSLWDGPLSVFVYYLVIAFTGLMILVRETWKVIDRVLGWVETAIICVAFLVMVGLSFNDYLAQEWKFSLMDLEGGPNMALVLMVWVGFLGASLATRQRKHLAVDATDRVLSAGAAKFAARFTALVAAGLSWVLAKAAWALVTESVGFQDSVEGLKVWALIEGPLNAAIGLLPGTAGDGSPWPTVAAGDGFPLWIAQLVLPLAFALMAVRFGFRAVFLIDPPPDDDADDQDKLVAPGPVVARPGSRTPKDVILAGCFPGLLVGLGAALYFGKGFLILAASIALVLMGAPLFVSIGTAALACAVLIGGYDSVQVMTDMFESTKKHELLAIPFFVLAGQLMTQGSIAERLIAFARAFMGRTPGGLGLAGVFACVIFAAISGSSPVTVIAIGTIMFPMLVKERYPERYSLGMLSTAGSLGIIIPPSIPMIVYAIVVSTPKKPLSPTDLFLAGVLPGMFIALMLAIYTLYATRKVQSPALASTGTSEGSYFGNLLTAARRGILSLLLPVLILGGIYGFLPFIKFTVTQAAVVAVVYALLVELLIHRELKPKALPKLLSESGVMMGSLFLIIVLAIAFNKFLSFQQIPQEAAAWLSERVDSQFTFIVLVNLFLLALGCVMDIMSAILIVAPLLAPIAASYGINPIHFGIMFIVNLEIGYLTPPMGINLFVASAVFKRPIVDVVKSIGPFLLLMLFSLIVIAWVPALSTWLVDWMAAAP